MTNISVGIPSITALHWKFKLRLKLSIILSSRERWVTRNTYRLTHANERALQVDRSSTHGEYFNSAWWKHFLVVSVQELKAEMFARQCQYNTLFSTLGIDTILEVLIIGPCVFTFWRVDLGEGGNTAHHYLEFAKMVQPILNDADSIRCDISSTFKHHFWTLWWGSKFRNSFFKTFQRQYLFRASVLCVGWPKFLSMFKHQLWVLVTCQHSSNILWFFQNVSKTKCFLNENKSM